MWGEIDVCAWSISDRIEPVSGIRFCCLFSATSCLVVNEVVWGEESRWPSFPVTDKFSGAWLLTVLSTASAWLPVVLCCTRQVSLLVWAVEELTPIKSLKWATIIVLISHYSCHLFQGCRNESHPVFNSPIFYRHCIILYMNMGLWMLSSFQDSLSLCFSCFKWNYLCYHPYLDFWSLNSLYILEVFC